MAPMSLRSNNLRLILATETEGLPSSFSSTQFIPMPHGQAIQTLEEAGLWLGPRPPLEEREDFRQIIPYIVLKSGSHFVRYTRTISGGESRLHGSYSLGVGGHVDLSDVVTTDGKIDLIRTLDGAAHREVVEELGEVDVVQKEWAGLLVENDSSVGRVHIGIIAIWNLAKLPESSAEDALAEITPRTATELTLDIERMETWSSMLIPWLRGPEFKP